MTEPKRPTETPQEWADRVVRNNPKLKEMRDTRTLTQLYAALVSELYKRGCDAEALAVFQAYQNR